MAVVDVPFPYTKLLDATAIEPDATPVVLAACGSYNPIHTGHVAMFEATKTALETGTASFAEMRAAKIKVIGGFISPVNDAYGKPGLVPFAARLALCEAAVETSDWISVDDWEGRQPVNQRSYTVLSRIGAKVRAHYPELHSLQVVFLCGADLFESFYKPGVWKLSLLRRIFSEMFIAAVCREGSPSPRSTMSTAAVLTAADEPDVSIDMRTFEGRVAEIRGVPRECCPSSTEIRRRIHAGLSVEGLVPQRCVPLLRSVFAS